MKNTKEHIINIALKLFLLKNFKEVTMKEIVEQTGLSKGAFYYYFESKETLFLEVVETIFSSMLFYTFEEYSTMSLYEFHHYFATTIDFQGNKFGDLSQKNSTNSFNENHISLIFDALKLSPEFKKKLEINRHKELNAWTDVIKRARNTGEIKSPMSDIQIAMIYIYIRNGVGLELVMNGDGNNAKNEYLKLWDGFYESIKI
jgi:AcrR family transcriptional regulator